MNKTIIAQVHTIFATCVMFQTSYHLISHQTLCQDPVLNSQPKG